MEISKFIELGNKFYQSRALIEVVGSPGIGKTSAVGQVCARLSKVYGSFGLTANAVSSMSSVDLRGYLFPNKEDGRLVSSFSRPPFFPSKSNTRVWIDGVEQPYGKADLPERGIVFLDERPQADAQMQKALAQVMLDRGYADYRLAPGWAIWSAGNRAADKSGVNRTLAMLRNRLVVIDVTTSIMDWLKWASGRVHPAICEWVTTANPFVATVPAEDTAFCTPRSLAILSDVAVSLWGGLDAEPQADAVFYEIASGTIGAEAATKLCGYLRSDTSLVSVKDILRGATKEVRADMTVPQAVSLASTFPEGSADREKVFAWAASNLPVRAVNLLVALLEDRDAAIVLTCGPVRAWIAKNPRYKSEYARLG